MPASLNLGEANSSVMGLPIGALCCASSCKEETRKTGCTGICHLAVPNNKRGQCRCLTAACLSFTLGGSGSGGGRGCGCGYGVECVVDQHHCPTLTTPPSHHQQLNLHTAQVRQTWSIAIGRRPAISNQRIFSFVRWASLLIE